MSAKAIKAVTYNSTGYPVDCLFCRIQQKLEPGSIVFEDKDFVVFKTIAPATANHLLITPREHIKNLDSLSGRKDAELLQKMADIGKHCLNQVDPTFGASAQYCFHIPPW